MSGNIGYNDMLDMDMNDINCVIEGLIDKREMNMNDALLVIGNAVGILNRAIWGSKENEFKLPIIRLRPKTDEEIMNEMRAEFNMINREIKKG